MFDRIFIKRNEADKKTIDIGKISECLLFYNQTDILVDKFLIENLCNNIDIGILHEFTKENILKIWIRKNLLSVAQFNTKIGETYTPLITGSEALNLSNQIYSIYHKLSGENKAKAKTLKRTFLDISEDFEYSSTLEDTIIKEWKDKNLLSQSMRTYVNQFLPNLNIDDLECEIVDQIKANGIFDSYKIICNKDLDQLSNQYAEILPKDFRFSIFNMLLRIVETRGDLDIASSHSSEIYSDLKNEPFIKNRFLSLHQKLTKSEENIELFQNITLEDYKPINDTIRMGERSFTEYSDIIRKSTKFKHWLKGLEEDKSLLSQYYQEVTKGTWIDKKPVKAARIAIFGAAGFLGNLAAGGIPIGTLVSSSADKFLVDPLLRGWKPNQFIDLEVKGFLPER